jgi:hypothetical protein
LGFGVVYHVLYVFRSHVVTLATTASKWLIRLASQQVYSLMCVCWGVCVCSFFLLSFSRAIDSHVTKSLFPAFLAKKDGGTFISQITPEKRYLVSPHSVMPTGHRTNEWNMAFPCGELWTGLLCRSNLWLVNKLVMKSCQTCGIKYNKILLKLNLFLDKTKQNKTILDEPML